MTNRERRQAQAEAKRDSESGPTMERLWKLYLDRKARTIATDHQLRSSPARLYRSRLDD